MGRQGQSGLAVADDLGRRWRESQRESGIGRVEYRLVLKEALIERRFRHCGSGREGCLRGSEGIQRRPEAETLDDGALELAAQTLEPRRVQQKIAVQRRTVQRRDGFVQLLQRPAELLPQAKKPVNVLPGSLAEHGAVQMAQ